MILGEVSFAFCLVLLVEHPVTVQAQRAVILEAPMNRTVGLGQPPLNLTCSVQGDYLFFRINDDTDHLHQPNSLNVSLATHDEGVLSQTATIEISAINNNTNFTCVGLTDDLSEDAVYSNVSFLIIIGPPLSPSLQYSWIDENTLNMFWEEPYTSDAEGFHITSYFLRVVDTYGSNENDTIETVLTDTALSADSRSFNVTQVAPTSCTNLTLQIWAENSVGNSSAGTAYGAFPFRPGPFSRLIRIEISFSQHLSPQLTIEFMFPSLCPFNNATYLIEIEDNSNFMHTVGPNILRWQDSAAIVNLELGDIELKMDTHYTVNITVWTMLGGEISEVASFDPSLVSATTDTTSISTTTDTSLVSAITDTTSISTTTDNLDIVTIASASIAAAVLVMIILIAAAMFIVYIFRRYRMRKRECLNTTEVGSNGLSMVPNLHYQGGPIYEEIDPNLYASALPQKNSYIPTEEKCSLKDKGNDDSETYTRMSSAGTLQALSGSNVGAAAVGGPDAEKSTLSTARNGGEGAFEGRYVMS